MAAELMEVPAPTQEILGGVSELETWARGLTIKNQPELESAVETLKGVKRWNKTIVEFFADSKQKAHSAWKAIVANEKSMTDKLDAVEVTAKLAINGYQIEQEKIRQAEQRRLQAIADEAARKEREKAEQEAAKQRAKEAEERAKAELARKQAEQATEAERKRLLAEAEAADRKAAAAAVKAESKQDAADSVVASVVNVASTVEPVKGLAMRTVWKFRVVDAAIVPRDWLMVDEKALQGFATATKGGKPVAGIEFYSEQIPAIGGRA